MRRTELPIFAVRLKAVREAAGYSQRGLGIALGLDPDSAGPRMNQYERGRREPDLDMASRIAALLKVPLAYLYCEEDDIADALLALKKLSKSKRNQVTQQIKRLADERSGNTSNRLVGYASKKTASTR